MDKLPFGILILLGCIPFILFFFQFDATQATVLQGIASLAQVLVAIALGWITIASAQKSDRLEKIATDQAAAMLKLAEETEKARQVASHQADAMLKMADEAEKARQLDLDPNIVLALAMQGEPVGGILETNQLQLGNLGKFPAFILRAYVDGQHPDAPVRGFRFGSQDGGSFIAPSGAAVPIYEVNGNEIDVTKSAERRLDIVVDFYYGTTGDQLWCANFNINEGANRLYVHRISLKKVNL